MKNPISVLIINLGLLFFGSAMAFSGFLIQFYYHMGHHGDINSNNVVLGTDYSGWSAIHKISILIVSFIMIFHFILHWKWYKTVVKKKLISKNNQVIILTILFILVAITGYIPWFIKLTGGQEIACKAVIEIHDKLAIIFFVYLILHITKRLKWYFVTFIKLNK
jgi:hypothetical protein